MSESGLMMGEHLDLSMYNPNSANQDLLFKFTKNKIAELEEAVDNCTSLKSDDNSVSSYFRIASRGGRFSYLSSLLNNSSNEKIKKYICDEVIKNIQIILNRETPNNIGVKFEFINKILDSLIGRIRKDEGDSAELKSGLILSEDLSKSLMDYLRMHKMQRKFK